MAKKKNQHYVPQSYLRNFSVDQKNVGIFCFPKVESIEYKMYYGPIRNQASKDYFYSKELEIENFLGVIEKEGMMVINGLLDSQCPFVSLSCTFVLYKFMMLQYFRTMSMADFLENFCSDFLIEQLQHKAKHELDSHLVFKWGIPSFLGLNDFIYKGFMCTDLSFKFLTISSDVKDIFLTSDNPVCIINPYYEALFGHHYVSKLDQTGLIIYFPLSPTKAIVYYDAYMYKFGGKDESTIKISSNIDVQILNSIMISNAYNSVYFTGKMSYEKMIGLKNCDFKKISFFNIRPNWRGGKILIRSLYIYMFLDPLFRVSLEETWQIRISSGI